MNAISAKVVDDIPLHVFAEDNIRSYGTYVVSNRALPDFRDGLKPVHRCILWAMHKMGIHNHGAYKKASRITGDCVGKFHPHGDASVFGAMVSVAGTYETSVSGNCPVPLVHGQGNWGELNQSPAAPRYVECKLSKYSDYNFFQPEYIAVTPTHPNYDGEETEPLVLPSLLPNLLLNGAEGIAVGVITGIPAYSIESVKKIIELALSGTKIKSSTCLKHLRVQYQYGGKCVNTQEELLEFYKTGVGQLRMEPEYEIDGKRMTVTGVPPYFNMEKAKSRLMDIPEVASAVDHGDVKQPINLIITFKGNDSEKAQEKCIKILSSSTNLRLNITKRISEEKVEFYSWSMPQFINNWCQWRIDLEKRAQQYIADKLKNEIAHLNLMVLACNNLDIIKKVIEQPKENLDERLAKALKITVEQAGIILAMTVRRLSRLSKDDTVKTIAKKTEEMKTALKHVQNPNAKILNDLARMPKF